MFLGPIKYLASDILDPDTIPLVRNFGSRFSALAPGAGGKRIIREAIVSASKAITPPYITTVVATPPTPTLFVLAGAFYSAADFGAALYPLAPLGAVCHGVFFPQARIRILPEDESKREKWPRDTYYDFDSDGVFSIDSTSGVFSFRPVGDPKTRFEFPHITDVHMGVWDRGVVLAVAQNIFPNSKEPSVSESGIGISLMYAAPDIDATCFNFSMPEKRTVPRLFGINISPKMFKDAFEDAVWATKGLVHGASASVAFKPNMGFTPLDNFGSVVGDTAAPTGADGMVAAFVHYMQKDKKPPEISIAVATPLAWGDYEPLLPKINDYMGDVYAYFKNHYYEGDEISEDADNWSTYYEPKSAPLTFANPDNKNELKNRTTYLPRAPDENMVGVGVGVWKLPEGELRKYELEPSKAPKVDLVDVSVTRATAFTDTIGDLIEEDILWYPLQYFPDPEPGDDPIPIEDVADKIGRNFGRVSVYGVACANYQERYSDGFSDSSFAVGFWVNNETEEGSGDDTHAVTYDGFFVKTGRVSASSGELKDVSVDAWGVGSSTNFLRVYIGTGPPGSEVPDLSGKKSKFVGFCNSGTDVLLVTETPTHFARIEEYDAKSEDNRNQGLFFSQVDFENVKLTAVFPESPEKVDVATSHTPLSALAAEVFLNYYVSSEAVKKTPAVLAPSPQQKIAVRSSDGSGVHVLTAEYNKTNLTIELYLESVGGEDEFVFPVPMDKLPPNAKKVWAAGSYQLTELLPPYPQTAEGEEPALPAVLLLTYNGLATVGANVANAYPATASEVRRLITRDFGETWERFIDDGFSPMYYLGNQLRSVSRSPVKERDG